MFVGVVTRVAAVLRICLGVLRDVTVLQPHSWQAASFHQLPRRYRREHGIQVVIRTDACRTTVRTPASKYRPTGPDLVDRPADAEIARIGHIPVRRLGEQPRLGAGAWNARAARFKDLGWLSFGIAWNPPNRG